MSGPEQQQQVGMSASDIANLTAQQQASSAGGAGEGGLLINLILRIFKLNADSTGGGLDAIFGIGQMTSGLSLMAAKGLQIFDTAGGFFRNLFSGIQGPQGPQVQHAPVNASSETSSNADGGDAPYASLNTIPSNQMDDLAAHNLKAQQVQNVDHVPVRSSESPKGKRSAASQERG